MRSESGSLCVSSRIQYYSLLLEVGIHSTAQYITFSWSVIDDQGKTVSSVPISSDARVASLDTHATMSRSLVPLELSNCALEHDSRRK